MNMNEFVKEALRKFRAGEMLSKAEEEAVAAAKNWAQKNARSLLPEAAAAAESGAPNAAAPGARMLNPGAAAAAEEGVPSALKQPAPLAGLRSKLGAGEAAAGLGAIGAIGAMNAGPSSPQPVQPEPANVKVAQAEQQGSSMQQMPAAKPAKEDKGGLDPSVMAGFRRLQQQLETERGMSDNEKTQLNEKNNQAMNKLESLRDIYQQEIKSARSQAEKNQAINEWAQIGETVGNALAQMGAAENARKNKLNSPDVKLAKADWNSKYDQILKNLELRQREALKSAEMGAAPVETEQKNIQAQIQNLDRRGEKLRELQASLKERELGLAQGSVEKARERTGAAERTEMNVEGKKDIAGAKEGQKESAREDKSAEQRRKEENAYNVELNKLGALTGKNKTSLPNVVGKISSYLVSQGVSQAEIDAAAKEAKGAGSMDAKDQEELKQKFIAMLQKARTSGQPSSNLAVAKAMQPKLITRAQLQSVMQKMGGVSEDEAKRSILDKLPNAKFE